MFRLSRYACLFLLWACYGGILHAQTYLPGYLVEKEGRRVEGLLLPFLGNKLPNEVSFKANANATPRVYEAAEVREIGFQPQAVYHSVAFSPSQRVFMRVLVQGRANLYEYDDTFYATHPDEPLALPLVVKDTLLESDRGTVARTLKPYVNVLRTRILKGCPNDKLTQQTRSSRLTAASLRALFTAYNTCVGESGLVLTNIRPKVTWGPTVGFQMGNIFFRETDAARFGLLNTRFPYQPNYQVGLQLRVSSRLRPQGKSLEVNLLYEGNTHYEVDYVRTAWTVYREIEQNRIDLTYLKIPFIVGFGVSNSALAPRVGFGISPNITLRRTYRREVFSEANGVRRSDGIYGEDPPPYYQLGLLAQGEIMPRVGNMRIPVGLRAEVAAINLSTRGAGLSTFKSASHIIFSLRTGLLF